MSTECYAMVRGSALRVTGLDARGALPGDIQYAVSEAAVRVVINEVIDGGSNEIQRNDDEERRLHLVSPTETIRYTVDIEFLRVDPGLLSLSAGIPLVQNEAGDIVGFDADTKIPAAAFALEVWSKLAGSACADGKRWGYTLFPFLKGGMLSGFVFGGGLVSFNLRLAQTRRGSLWGRGPYFVDGSWTPLAEPVSRNTNWRTTLVSMVPPAQTDGVVEYVDEIDGGTASMTTSDEVDGGTPWSGGLGDINGGAA